GNQLVLLRFTDDTGWQVADVLRNPGGSAFQLLPPSQRNGGILVEGAMAPSGEAWLWISKQPAGAPPPLSQCGPPYCGLFHRLPGGSFVFDASATAALGVGLLHPIVNDGTSSLRLKVTDGGTLYGMLVSPEQQAASAMVPAPGGKQVAGHTPLR